MAAVQFFLPYRAAVKPTNIGAPGAKMSVYIPGTTTKRPIYATTALTTQLANPVTADGSGAFPPIYMDGALTYKIVIADKTGATLQTFDPYIPGEAPDATALQPYQDAAAASATASASSASAAAGSASSASTSASSASGSAAAASTSASSASASAAGAAASETAAEAAEAGTIAALGGTPLSSANIACASRAILAAADHSAGLPAILTESGREGVFVWSSSSLSSQVTSDPQQGVYVAPLSDASGASGAWIRKAQVLTPRHFGAVADGATDDAAALQAFLDFAAANSGYRYHCGGAYKISSGLTLDGGTFGNNTVFALDFGECHITASAAMDKMLTIQDCYAGQFPGLLHLIGTGSTGDVIANWTCNVGLYLDNCAQSSFGSIYGEGLNYAAVEVESQPGNNDSLHIGNVVGKRVSSGDSSPSTRTLSANWSNRVQSGSYGSNSQTETITVDAFPNTYVTGADGTPTHPIYVEIDSILHHVDNVNRAAGTITLGRWLQSAVGASGTLRYHYGAVLVLNGSDSNIFNIGQVSQVGGGCAVDFADFYGGHIAQVHMNSGGGAVRIGGLLGAESGQQFGLTIGQLYVESGHELYDICATSRSTSHVKILSRSASTSSAKILNTHSSLQSDETYNTESYMIGLTISAPEGFHFPRKRFVGTASEAIDFSKPKTFPGQVFYSKPTVDTATFTLTAPTTNQQRAFGYDCANVTVIGRTSHGGPAGTITFTPPASHTINGGAASAAIVFSGFDCPPTFAIYYDDNGAWTIRQVNARLSASATLGIGYTTGSGGTVTQATNKSTAVTLNKVTGAITMNGAALGAGAKVSFTLNNNTILADDHLSVRIKSGNATADTYKVRAEGNAVGSRTITLENISAGSLSEAVVVGFILVRGATA